MSTIKDDKGRKPLSRITSEREAKREVEATLNRLGKVAVEAFQDEIRRSSWNRKPENLINSFEYEVKGTSIRVTSDHPAVQYLDKGVKPHQMIYLSRAERPIPIIKDNGEVIFRQASSQSLADGSWKHPGISGKHFMERGKEKAAKAVKEELAKTYKDIIRKALKG